MVYHITKYGSGVNGGNIQFGVDKFGFSYGGDNSFASAPTDYITIEEEIGSVYTLVRFEDIFDDMGTIISSDKDVDVIFPGIIQDITSKDRKLHEIGLVVPGSRKLFSRPSFGVTSGGVTVNYTLKEGDIFKDNKGVQWRIVKIPKEWDVSENQVYRIHIIEKINLEGSP